MRESAALAAHATEKVVCIIYGNKLFMLKKPINIRFRREGYLYVHEYKPLRICAYGSTKRESLEAFAEEFSSCWHWIALEKDEKLTKDAHELKYKLLELVETVASLK